MQILYENFFGMVTSLNFSSSFFFGDRCVNYVSIIVIKVSNITVLVYHNVIFSGHFMNMSHDFNNKTPPSASPTSLSPSWS